MPSTDYAVQIKFALSKTEHFLRSRGLNHILQSAPCKIVTVVVGQDRPPEVQGSIGSYKDEIFLFDKVYSILTGVGTSLFITISDAGICSEFFRLLIKCSALYGHLI